MAGLSSLDCYEQCRRLYDAYGRMLSGEQVVQVRYADNWKEFRANTAGDMDRLRDLYMTLWRQCPTAQANLPSLDPRSLRRGPPARLRV